MRAVARSQTDRSHNVTLEHNSARNGVENERRRINTMSARRPDRIPVYEFADRRRPAHHLGRSSRRTSTSEDRPLTGSRAKPPRSESAARPPLTARTRPAPKAHTSRIPGNIPDLPCESGLPCHAGLRCRMTSTPWACSSSCHRRRSASNSHSGSLLGDPSPHNACKPSRRQRLAALGPGHNWKGNAFDRRQPSSTAATRCSCCPHGSLPGTGPPGRVPRLPWPTSRIRPQAGC